MGRWDSPTSSPLNTNLFTIQSLTWIQSFDSFHFPMNLIYYVILIIICFDDFAYEASFTSKPTALQLTGKLWLSLQAQAKRRLCSESLSTQLHLYPPLSRSNSAPLELWEHIIHDSSILVLYYWIVGIN